MGSASNPKAWVPYMKNEDCSQGFCSFYCPQWCYMILPPPPPAFQFPDDASARNFSPLVIAIIGILGSAFLLLSYYTMISKYCGNNNARSLTRESHDQEAALEEGRHHEPWHGGAAGLDEALIKSITVFKYKKGDGLVEGMDCSVCLSEFEEDESLRLLPKCSHAFHVQCIDTWLSSHSNCPLCRACIAPAKPEFPLAPPVAVAEQVMHNSSVPSDSGNTNININISVGDIIMDAGADEEDGEMRRSVSVSQSRVSVADILSISESEEGDGGGSSEQGLNKSKRGSSPVAMKRSFSSGRFFMSSRHQCGV